MENIEKLRQQVAQHPDSAVFVKLANALRKAGSLEEAASVLRDGLVRKPAYHTARKLLARVRYDSGDFEGAVSELLKVVAEEPADREALLGLGDSCSKAGRDGESLEYYQKVLEIDPENRMAEINVRRLTGQIEPEAAALEELCVPPEEEEVIEVEEDLESTMVMGSSPFEEEAPAASGADLEATTFMEPTAFVEEEPQGFEETLLDEEAVAEAGEEADETMMMEYTEFEPEHGAVEESTAFEDLGAASEEWEETGFEGFDENPEGDPVVGEIDLGVEEAAEGEPPEGLGGGEEGANDEGASPGAVDYEGDTTLYEYEVGEIDLGEEEAPEERSDLRAAAERVAEEVFAGGADVEHFEVSGEVEEEAEAEEAELEEAYGTEVEHFEGMPGATEESEATIMMEAPAFEPDAGGVEHFEVSGEVEEEAEAEEAELEEAYGAEVEHFEGMPGGMEDVDSTMTMEAPAFADEEEEPGEEPEAEFYDEHSTIIMERSPLDEAVMPGPEAETVEAEEAPAAPEFGSEAGAEAFEDDEHTTILMETTPDEEDTDIEEEFRHVGVGFERPGGMEEADTTMKMEAPAFEAPRPVDEGESEPLEVKSPFDGETVFGTEAAPMAGDEAFPHPVEDVFEVVEEAEEEEAPAEEVPGPPGLTEPEGDDLAEADACIERGDYAGAMQLYEAVAEKDPENGLVLQKMQELRMLLKVEGRDSEYNVRKLEKFLDAVHRRRDEFYAGS